MRCMIWEAALLPETVMSRQKLVAKTVGRTNSTNSITESKICVNDISDKKAFSAA